MDTTHHLGIYTNTRHLVAVVVDDETIVLPNGREMTLESVDHAWDETDLDVSDSTLTAPQLDTLTRILTALAVCDARDDAERAARNAHGKGRADDLDSGGAGGGHDEPADKKNDKLNG